jgi:H+/Cl- antiporter ClcA
VPDAHRLADVLRGPGYLRLLGFCALIGVPISAAAFGFLAGEHQLRHLLWDDLPDAVGLDGPPWWWGVPSLTIAGVLVALAIARLPGHGGHVPADSVGAAPTQPPDIPGVLLAGAASLCLGAVIGPEGVLLALGSGAALWLVPSRWRGAHPQDATIIGFAGAFAAIATVFGSPLTAAIILMEAVGFGGARLFALMLPGLLASGIGALVFTGLGRWTGLQTDTLALPPLPSVVRPDIGDVLWAVPLGVLAALLTYAVRLGSRRVLPIVRRDPWRLVPAAGALVGASAAVYALTTGHPPDEALFSGQQTIVTLIDSPQLWTDWALVALIACTGVGYALSLAAFRGGPVFPAIFIAVAVAELLAGLPGLGTTPAVAALMAAFAVSMLRLPVASLVLVAILIGSAGIAMLPIAILGAVTAFVVTELLDPPARRDSA